MAQLHDQLDRFIVGIDFGTTFSGVAFTYSGNNELPDEISVVKNWPGGNNITSDKVPSELSYRFNPSGDDDGAQVVQWGYQLKPEQPRLRCLKLRLDPNQDLPSYVTEEELSNQLTRCGKTTEQAISDYLAVLHRQAMAALATRYGQHMVSTTKIDIVLTVPAVWSDAAKDATCRAAVLAGMGTNLSMISEPEAAAAYALKSLENPVLRVGDNFIVCDAGGGSGGLCGGVMLNHRFEELVKKRMGDKAFKNLREKKPKSWAVALKYFEDYVKRNFDPTSSENDQSDYEDMEDYDDNTFNVPLPGVGDDTAAGIECGFMVVTTAEVAEVFRPIVNSVIELVEEQKESLLTDGKVAKGVVLVGGFGQSNHLLKSLKARFSNEDSSSSVESHVSSLTLVSDRSTSKSPSGDGNTMVVLQPINAWTAVVRGAVLDRLEYSRMVTSRKSRRHYGVYCCKNFDASAHSIENKFWDHVRGMYKADNQINWHIQKGQTLPTSQAIVLDFNDVWDLTEYPKSTRTTIVVSDAEEAPKEHKRPKTRKLCQLEVDLTGVPRAHFQEVIRPDGERYRGLEHSIGMTVQSGTICFDLRIDGVIYGVVKADYQ